MVIINTYSKNKELKAFVLSYDISEQNRSANAKKLTWKELYSELAKHGYIEYDLWFHVMGWKGTQIHTVRPSESTWIFYSKKTLKDINMMLNTFAIRGLIWNVSEIQENEDRVLSYVNLDYDTQMDMNEAVNSFRDGM